MKTSTKLRREAHPACAWTHLRLVALAAVAAFAGAFSLVLLAGCAFDTADETPFLQAALGRPAPHAPLVRAPARGVSVDVRKPGGYAITAAKGTLALRASDARGGAWQRFENGVMRTTPFGAETVTIEPGRTEQHLTVRERQGQKTWRWRLDVPRTLEPRLTPDGQVRITDPTSFDIAGFLILPAEILDASGRGITPSGLRWSLAQRRGEWYLELPLDDRELPLPYVIDPATIAVTNTPTTASTGAGATSLSVNLPAGVVDKDTLVAQIAWRGGTNQGAITAPAGWNLLVRTDRTTNVGQAIYWKQRTSTDNGPFVFDFGTSRVAVGALTAMSGANSLTPIDSGPTSASARGNRPTASGLNVVTGGSRLWVFFANDATASTPQFSLTGLNEQWDLPNAGGAQAAGYQTQVNGGPTGDKQGSSWTADYVANAIAIKPDTNPPPATTPTIGTTSPATHTYKANDTFYYRSGVAGYFIVQTNANDAESGVKNVNVKHSLTGFSPTNVNLTAAPWTQRIDYTSTATAAGTGHVDVTDAATNPQLNIPWYVVRDDAVAAPGFATPTGAYVKGTVSVTSAPSETAPSASQSGMKQIEYGYCPGATCTYGGAGWVALGVDATAPYAVTWDTTALPDAQFTLLARATDNVGNVSTSTKTVTTDNTPPTHNVSLIVDSGYAYLVPAGNMLGTLYYRGSANGGVRFADDLDDDVAPAQDVVYPAISSGGWSHALETVSTAPSYTSSAFTWTAPATFEGLVEFLGHDSAGNESAYDLTLVNDTTAPTSSIGCVPASGCSAWATTSPVSVTITASDAACVTCVDTVRYTTDGSDPATSPTAITVAGATADLTVAATTTVKYFAVDKVGNTETAKTKVIQVDTTPPTQPSLSFSALTNVHERSGDLWFRPSASSGTVTVTATTSDVESGVASYSFPAAAAGWSRSVSGNQATYSWSAPNPTAPAGSQDTTATNNAGLVSSAAGFTLTADGAAPTTTMQCNGAACAGWYTSAPVAVTLDVADDSGGAGVKHLKYTTDGSDPIVSATATTVLAASLPASIALSTTTVVKYAAADNVGNAESVATVTVQVDTSAPTNPTFTYSGFTNTHAAAGTVWFKAGAGGGFTATASASDPESGVTSYAFPALGGTWSGSQSGAQYSYTFDASSPDPVEPKNVTATNAAGLTTPSGSSLTVTADGAAPTTTVQCNGAVCSGWYTTAPVTIALAASDNGGGSGVNLIKYTVDGSDPTSSGTATTVLASSTSFTRSATTTVKYVAYDNVNNVEATGTVTVQIDTSTPSAPTFAYSGLSSAYQAAGIVWFRSGATGSFTVAASSTDAESGVSSYAFPSLGTGWSGTQSGAQYTFDFDATAVDPVEPKNVTATNAAGLTTSPGSSLTVTADGTAPTTTATCSPAAACSGWTSTTPVSVTLSSSDNVGGAGVLEIRYTTDGSTPTVFSPLYMGAVAVFGTAAVKFRAWDRVGNVEPVVTVNVQIDTSAPSAPSITLSESSPWSYTSGSQLWYSPSGSNSGAFTVTATASDAQSGIQKVNFPALGNGFTGGGDDSSSPYVGSYTWNSTANSDPGSVTATAYNNASLSTTGVFTVTKDVTKPNGNSLALTNGAGYYTSLSVALTPTDGSDGGAGIDTSSRVYERDEAPLSNGSCGGYSGTWTTVSNPDTSVVSGKCYIYRLKVSDRVGNQSNASTATGAAQIDTSAPPTPTLAFTNLSSAWYDGAGVLYYRPGASSGSYRVTQTASDAQSGIAGYTFSAAASGWARTTSTSQATYSWSAANPAEPGAGQTAAATNNAGLSSAAATYAVTADAAAPTGMSATVTGGYHATASVAVATANGSDTGSGVDAASAIVERDEATLSNDMCGAFPNTWGATVTLSGGADTTVTSGKCYRYRLKVSDRVGNQATSAASATAKVDTSAPAAPSLTFGTFTNASSNGLGTVFYRPGAASGSFTVTALATDAQSSVASYSFPAAASGWSRTVSGNQATYSFSAPDPTVPGSGQSVTATNNASLTSPAATFTVSADSSVPATTDNSGTIGSGWRTSNTSVTLSPVDTGSNVDKTYYTTDGSEPTTASAQGTTVSLTTDGVYTIKYFSTDKVGNTEGVKTAGTTIRIDKSAPSAVTLDALPGFIRSGQTLTGAATDAGPSGIDSVTYYYCTPAPCMPDTLVGWSSAGPGYAVTWTGQPADGEYVLLTRASDVAGNSADSTTRTVTIDNTAPTASLTAPADGSAFSGTVAVSASATDVGGSGVDSVAFEYRPAGGGAWTALGAPDTTAPYSVNWATGAVAEGDYEVRATSTDAAGNPHTTAARTVTVDRTAPTAALDPVAANIRASVGLTVTTADTGGSGVANVRFQRSPAGAGSWTTIDTVAASPYTTTFDTTAVGDGLYDLRAVAVDRAGNETPVVTTSRRVDNTPPTGPVTAPAALSFVNGTVTVSGDPADAAGSGVAQIVFQRSPKGANSWTAIGSATEAPWQTAWNTTLVGDDAYELRAVTTDAAGNSTTSSTREVNVDNNPPGITLTAPGAYINASAPDPFTVTATRTESDVDTVEFLRCSNASAACASGSWISLGVDSTPGDGFSAQWPLDADGNRALRAVATDRAGSTGEDVVDTTIDTVLPAASIDAQPADPSGDTTPTFSFSADETATLECKLDGGTWEACSSPRTLSPLADGSHTFSVRATDPAGNTGAADAATWTIDTGAPQTTITSSPANPSNDATPSITFSADEAATYECRLDAGSWEPCTSPRALGPLAGGAYTFDVRATDAAGNEDATPATVTWTADLVAPTSAAATLPAYRTAPVFTIAYASDGTGSAVDQVELWVDGPGAGGYVLDRIDADATGEFTFTAADGDGAYRFYTRARDAAGNAESVPASEDGSTFLDTAAPTSAATALPPYRGSVTLTVAYTSDDGGSGVDEVELWVDGPGAGGFVLDQTDASPDGDFTFTATEGDGAYRFHTRARDAAGNGESAPASEDAATLLDTTPPSTPTFALSGLTNAAVTGSTVYFRPGAAGGFTLATSSSDGESGIASYSYPALGAGWSRTGGDYTFTTAAADPADPNAVTATNGSGLVSPATEFTVTADSAAPVTSASCNGAACSGGWYTSSPVTVSLSAVDAAAGVDQIRYTTDGSDPTIISGSLYLGAFAVPGEGTNTIKFRAFDRVGNAEPVRTLQVRIDTNAPETTIDSGPAGALASGAASFTFSSDDPAATFECRLDGGAFAACSSPKSYSGLVDGSHTFEVRAVDAASIPDPTPASRTWTVDTVAAETSMTSAPAAATTSTTASFSFLASDAGPTFECKLDGGAYSACTSPKSYPGLTEGAHTFSVRAVDAAGNSDGTPAEHTWTVDTAAPNTSIDVSPADPSANTTPTFSFSSTESPSTYEVDLDGGGWVAATTPLTISPALGDGSHTLQVRVTDAAGNTDATPASFTWFVDATAPTGSLTAPPDGSSVSGVIVVGSNSADAGGSGVMHALFEHSPAGAGSWTTIGVVDTTAPYSASLDTTMLADGDHDLRVTTRDNAGNPTVSPLRTVQVDNTAPSLSASVPNPVNLATTEPATLTATASDAGTGIASVAFEQCNETSVACDSDAWTSLAVDTTTPYSAPWPLPTDGTRLLRFRATDGAGRQRTQLVLTTVDRTAPASLLTAPADGASLRADAAVSASASDPVPGGVDAVEFQITPEGAPFSSPAFASDSSGPAYDGTLDTTGHPDGLYDLRAFVNDANGNSSASARRTVRIDNTPPTGAVTAPAEGANLRSTVNLTSNSADGGSGVASVQFQRSPAGAGAWTNQAASWDTALVADGQYDVRVVTTDEAGNVFTSSAITVRVDNTSPTGTLAEPDDGSDVRGTVTLTSDSNDAGSGVATVQFQRSPSGTGSWTGQAAGWNTTLVADGLYDLRVITTDNAGNAFTSAVVTVRVDNTSPTGAITAPASGAEFGAAPIALTSDSADAGSGVDTVVFERRQAGTSDPWSPTSTPWNTASGPDQSTDGLYELRVRTTDRAGNSSSSGAITVLVDNSPPTTSASLAPGSPSNAPVTVSFTASDGSGSGVSVTSYRVDGGSLQQGSAAVIGAPGDHSNDGSHVVEFFSTDEVGNVETPESVTVVIDTTAPSGSPGDPGSYLRGIALLSYATPDTDVSSVQFQFSPAGANAWAGIGAADVTPPYEASWNTTLVADAGYDLRAVVTDGTGNVANTLLPGLPKYVDNTAPAGAVTPPAAASLVSGRVDMTATGSDGASPPASGVAAVRFEIKPSGAGSFTPFGTETAPVVGTTYRRSLDTTAHPDGPAELRVVVTDVAGNETTSAARTITIDNVAPTVGVVDPGAALSGTTTLTATAAADTASVTFERRPAGGGGWTAVVTDSTPGDGFTADLATNALTDGMYELRARAVDSGGNWGTSGIRTVRVDNELPTGSITQPGAGDLVGGSAVALAATADDTGSGVATVEFSVKPNGSASYTTISTDSAAPFAATWDVSGVADGAALLRLVITDAAGNQRQAALVSVTVDSTGPSVVLDDLGADVSGSVSLTATTGGGAARVVFGISAAGSGAWTQVAEDTTAPFGASFDSSTFADGLYDVRAIGYDALGNASAPAMRSRVRLDNTAPQLVSSEPNDGSVSASVNEIVLIASESAVVTGATFDGSAAPAPTVSGSRLTFATGALGEGLHVLSGRLQDSAGSSVPFRVAVTVESTPAPDRPPVERSASRTQKTVVTAAGSLATAAVAPAAWPATSSSEDFIVVRVDPTLPLPGVAPRLSPGTPVIEVTARWALSGNQVTQFEAPIAITIPNAGGSAVVPAVSQDAVSWRALPLLPGPALPAGQQDGFYRDADGVHVLTRHLTYFTLLRDVTRPTPPRHTTGVVADDGLTLRWAPGIDDSGELGHVVLHVNGESYGLFDPTQLETKLGRFTPDDTRTFTFVQVDAAGNRSEHSPPLRGVPAIVGTGREQAQALLAARGFEVGRLTYDPTSDKAPGTVLGYEGNALAVVGTEIDLRIAGPAPQTQLVLGIAIAKRLVLARPQTVGARVTTSRPAQLTATLRSPQGRVLHTWRFSVGAGVRIVTLPFPAKAKTPGRHRLVWVARAGTSTVRRSLVINLMAPFDTRPVLKRLQVVVATARPLRIALPSKVRILAQTEPEETYSISSSRRHDVRVVVVDVDAYGIRFLTDLRRVFPYMRLVAVASDRSTVRHAKAAGASVGLLRSRLRRGLTYAILGR